MLFSFNCDIIVCLFYLFAVVNPVFTVTILAYLKSTAGQLGAHLLFNPEIIFCRLHTYLRVQLMAEHALKAPGRVAELGGGEAVLLEVDGEDGELAGGQLAAVLVSRRREKDTEAGLVVDGATRGVAPIRTYHVLCLNDEILWNVAIVTVETPFMALCMLCHIAFMHTKKYTIHFLINNLFLPFKTIILLEVLQIRHDFLLPIPLLL